MKSKISALKQRAVLVPLALAGFSCNTDLCNLLNNQNNQNCSKADMSWVAENKWFDNQIDLRKTQDGRIEQRRLGGTSNSYEPNISMMGSYSLTIEDVDGKPVFVNKLDIGEDFKTAHWPARGGEYKLKVKDEDCNTLLEEDVSFLSLRY